MLEVVSMMGISGGEGLQRRDGGGPWWRRPLSPARIRRKHYVAGGGRPVIGGVVAETMREGVITFVVESSFGRHAGR